MSQNNISFQKRKKRQQGQPQPQAQPQQQGGQVANSPQQLYNDAIANIPPLSTPPQLIADSEQQKQNIINPFIQQAMVAQLGQQAPNYDLQSTPLPQYVDAGQQSRIATKIADIKNANALADRKKAAAKANMLRNNGYGDSADVNVGNDMDAVNNLAMIQQLGAQGGFNG